MSLPIRVIDTATPALNRLVAGLSPESVANECGPRVQRLVQRHYRSLGSNSKGYPTTHFWPGAARATSWYRTAGGFLIQTDKIGVAQRYSGGDIFPVKAGALTIPADPAAYGHTARDFSDLVRSVQLNPATGRLQACLVQAKSSEIKIGNKREDGSRKVTHTASNLGTRVFYWLCKHIHQKPNHNIIPTEGEFFEEVEHGVRNIVSRARGQKQ